MSLIFYATLGLVGLAALCCAGRARSYRGAIFASALGMVAVTALISAVEFFPSFFPIVLATTAAAVLALPVGLVTGPIGLWLQRRLNPGTRRGGVIAAVAGLGTMVFLALTTPHGRISVPWPDRDVVVRIERWGFPWDEWWVVVETPHGHLSSMMWQDWGPARTANIYQTPRGSLGVIGAGALGPVIDIASKAMPRRVPGSDIVDGDDWEYLGVVTRQKEGLVFIAASAGDECIPLYGAGFVPIRKKFQNSDSNC